MGSSASRPNATNSIQHARRQVHAAQSKAAKSSQLCDAILRDGDRLISPDCHAMISMATGSSTCSAAGAAVTNWTTDHRIQPAPACPARKCCVAATQSRSGMRHRHSDDTFPESPSPHSDESLAQPPKHDMTKLKHRQNETHQTRI